MEPRIKIDLNYFLQDKKPIILELGCGEEKGEGRIGIDKCELKDVDIIADLEYGLPFIPNDSVDAIYSKSLFEHITNFDYLMKEICRVLKKGGKNYLIVPHFSNPYYYSDFTHKRQFGLYTFFYFVSREFQLKRKVPNFYTDIRIKVLSQKLIFGSPFKWRNLIKRAFGKIINQHTCLQEYYEENLCYIFPCYGIEVIFTPEK